METPSFFSRATGTLVNPLSKAVDSVREVIAHHAGDPDEKLLLQNMLQLFVVVLRADGEPVTDASALREQVQQGGGAPLSLDILRDGEPLTVEVTPAATTVDGQTMWLIGITLITDYDFPIDVTIQLNNVGGPSAGMMFALGIMDTLTPGNLNGGQNVAGTGTITADGTVGPIGGIQQKMWGAYRADADYFLAPVANCSEVVGEIPGDLQVFSVQTLDDALTVLDTISSGGDLSQLPTCE